MFLGINSHSLLALSGTIIPRNYRNIPGNYSHFLGRGGIIIPFIPGMFLEYSWIVPGIIPVSFPGIKFLIIPSNIGIIPERNYSRNNSNNSWNVPGMFLVIIPGIVRVTFLLHFTCRKKATVV